ncbi:MAG TPA: protein kinase, partial [Kofleriaceae bacterium]|nr:protein kinase [Kofleriaceae bacterium]
MTSDPTAPTVTAFGGTQHRVELPAIGEQIDRYAILAELGTGAMGAVFLAADTQLDRRIAVKVLTRGTQDGRLLDEARALAKLQHPNVVAIHDVGRWNERVYLAMEYIEGGSLANWLDTHDDWRERLATFVQAAQGLAAAHRAGLVHHDVKPSNIMVGNDGRVRLVDFGLARSTPELAEGTPAGTPRYMSPEQRRGVLADARTDQFSLCVALYEALFDDHPFAGASAEERGVAVLEDRVAIPKSARVPPHIVNAVIKGLACDPARRHPTIDALIGALLAAPKSRRRIAWIGAAISIAIAGGITAAIVTSSAPSDDRVIVPADARKAILAASNLPEELHEPLPGDPYGVTIHRLSNGLTVYISTNHDVPRVRAMWRFNGGNGDAPGIAAAAGLVATEHGTETIGTINYAAEKPHLDRIRELYRERAPATGDARTRIDHLIDLHSTLASLVEIPDEHERIVAGLGASYQSHTVFPHEMKFTTELPSNRLGAWADVEADVWTHRVIRNFRARLRRLNVETQDAVASVDLRAFDGLLATWFPGEHHEASTHDLVAGMATEPLDAVEAYARDHFVPNNADLVLAGDVDPTTAIPLLEKAFA